MATYDPKKIVCFVNNVLITGYAPGSFVTCERNEDSFVPTVGASGEVAWTVNNNRMGKITFKLMQTSQDNALLSAMIKADEADGGGIGPVVVSDLLGNTLVSGNGRLVKPANVEFGKDLAEREWSFHVEKLIEDVGGTLTP